MDKVVNLLGRVFLAHIFILAGINKIGGYEGTAAYMDSMGVPGMLLPLVIILEIGGGLAVLIGWQTRIMSLLLAGFSIVAAILFHGNISEQVQMIMFMKNWAIAGGLMVLAANGAGAYSLDNRNQA